MDHRLELSAFEPLPKFRRRNEIGNLPANEIAPFIIAAEDIADGDIGAPGLVEAGNYIRSDKPGPAGDQQHRYFKTGLKDRSGPLADRRYRTFAPDLPAGQLAEVGPNSTDG